MEQVEGKWHDTLQQLRLQLRRGMDGEISSHQRKMGLDYGINFGVNLLRLREMADTLPHDKELAQLMWVKDVREMRLLSLMIRQPHEVSFEEAIQLSSEVDTLELAEQLVFRLLRFVPSAPEILTELFAKRLNMSTPSSVVPYLLLNHLANDERLTEELFNRLRPQIIEDFSSPDFYLPSIIYTALQRIIYDRPELDVLPICEEVERKGGEVQQSFACDLISIIKEEEKCR